jgi:N-acetyltransferase
MTHANWLQPVTLAGPVVRLEPLAPEHCDDLVAAASDGELWNLWYATVPSPQQMPMEIARRLALFESGTMLPFAAIDAATGRAAGMTTSCMPTRPTGASKSDRRGIAKAFGARYLIPNANC